MQVCDDEESKKRKELSDNHSSSLSSSSKRRKIEPSDNNVMSTNTSLLDLTDLPSVLLETVAEYYVGADEVTECLDNLKNEYQEDNVKTVALELLRLTRLDTIVVELFTTAMSDVWYAAMFDITGVRKLLSVESLRKLSDQAMVYLSSWHINKQKNQDNMYDSSDDEDEERSTIEDYEKDSKDNDWKELSERLIKRTTDWICVTGSSETTTAWLNHLIEMCLYGESNLKYNNDWEPPILDLLLGTILNLIERDALSQNRLIKLPLAPTMTLNRKEAMQRDDFWYLMLRQQEKNPGLAPINRCIIHPELKQTAKMSSMITTAAEVNKSNTYSLSLDTIKILCKCGLFDPLWWNPNKPTHPNVRLYLQDLLDRRDTMDTMDNMRRKWKVVIRYKSCAFDMGTQQMSIYVDKKSTILNIKQKAAEKWHLQLDSIRCKHGQTIFCNEQILMDCIRDRDMLDLFKY